MMEVQKDEFSEPEIGSSVESFQKFLVSQRELFRSQIDQFQKIFVTQCNLAGVNPLSQEMAAGALSIEIGKRPRDLLNPKAVNYMQSIFSIKDAISKKGSRELSALLGITVTQIREFFASQRATVRRLVQSSRERTMRSNSCEEDHDEVLLNSDSFRPINPAPISSAGPSSVEDASCSTQDNALSVLDDLNKHFVENIFILMRKEESFSGQEKLMEWILKIQHYSVLCWFLSGGGLMILATWLSEAAVEEQTSFLLLILKVLCHLPLQEALPAHMSAILQCVNRLQFYRTSDISNRARVLLSKWSKLLARNQTIKNPHGVKLSFDAQKEMVPNQSFGHVMGTESWHPHIDVPEDFLSLSNKSLDNLRKVESPKVVKLLPASFNDSTKKPALGVSSSQARERRKVQLVDQPGQKTLSRSPIATRVGPVSQGRPMSADDIQKAKMRALYKQGKYGKTSSSTGIKESKTDGLHKPQTNQASLVASLSEVPLSPQIKDDKKLLLIPSKVSNSPEASLDSKLRMDFKVPLWEKCMGVQIPWKTPAELKLNVGWRVGAGENSKVIDVQKNRNQREEETVYQTFQEIPSNPKEPWDLEINYNDTLTPEIPIEQQPGGDDVETLVNPSQGATLAVQVAATSFPNCDVGTAKPDLELLAVLLKNPELVFALTSGQTGGLPSQETVKLLDMIKKGAANRATDMNGTQEKVEVPLPSPTPSSNPRASGWKTEGLKNPFVQQTSVPDRIIHNSPVAATTTNSAFSQIPATAIAVQPTNVAPYLLTQATDIVSSFMHAVLHTNSPAIQTPPSDIDITMNINRITANASSANLFSAHSPLAMRVDGICNLKPVPNLSTQEGFSNSFPQSCVLPSPTPPITATQQQRQPNLLQTEPHYHAPSHSHPPKTERQGPVSDLWRVGQDMSSNYHSQVKRNNYNAMDGGSRQSGSSRVRNDYAGEEFESWSPQNSPTRDLRNNSRRNLPESRMNPERNFRPEGSRQRDSSGFLDSGRHGNRKWRDQRR